MDGARELRASSTNARMCFICSADAQPYCSTQPRNASNVFPCGWQSSEAPASSRSFTNEGCTVWMARDSAVSRKLLRASTRAPCSTNNRPISVFPDIAASIRSVQPYSFERFGSSSVSSALRRTAASPRLIARWASSRVMRPMYSCNPALPVISNEYSSLLLKSEPEFHAEWLRDGPCDATTTGLSNSGSRCQLSPAVTSGVHEIRGAGCIASRAIPVVRSASVARRHAPVYFSDAAL